MFLFPPASLVALMNAAISPPFRLFIGGAEVLAAIGLTLPGFTRILPWLVPAAAAGLMIVMTGAAILHASRGEVFSTISTAMLFALLTFVAYMRWRVLPIPGRA